MTVISLKREFPYLERSSIFVLRQALASDMPCFHYQEYTVDKIQVIFFNKKPFYYIYT